MTSFKITNELRNVEIDKLIEKPTMKPRYNPIHYRFIDENDEVFHKFNIPNEYGYERGSHNIVYKNENFVIKFTQYDNKTDISDTDKIEYNKYKKNLQTIINNSDWRILWSQKYLPVSH